MNTCSPLSTLRDSSGGSGSSNGLTQAQPIPELRKRGRKPLPVDVEKRKAQNRRAQKTFREKRNVRVKELEASAANFKAQLGAMYDVLKSACDENQSLAKVGNVGYTPKTFIERLSGTCLEQPLTALHATRQQFNQGDSVSGMLPFNHCGSETGDVNHSSTSTNRSTYDVNSWRQLTFQADASPSSYYIPEDQLLASPSFKTEQPLFGVAQFGQLPSPLVASSAFYPAGGQHWQYNKGTDHY